MSLLIKNMEIPKELTLYVFMLHPDGKMDGLPYKAIPVPPHGRLIDAVMLRHKCYQHYEDFMNGKIDGETALLNIEKEIIGASTIIPAEEVNKK